MARAGYAAAPGCAAKRQAPTSHESRFLGAFDLELEQYAGNVHRDALEDVFRDDVFVGHRRIMPASGVVFQGAPDAAAVKRLVHREAAEHDDRDGIRHVAAKAARRLMGYHRARRKSVIRHYTRLLTQHDECSRGAGRLVLQSPVFEPGIQRGIAACKRLNPVPLHQGHGGRATKF